MPSVVATFFATVCTTGSVIACVPERSGRTAFDVEAISHRREREVRSIVWIPGALAAVDTHLSAIGGLCRQWQSYTADQYKNDKRMTRHRCLDLCPGPTRAPLVACTAFRDPWSRPLRR
jgi:hypothetical protein